MESTEAKIAYQEGFRDGYSLAIAVIDRCIEKKVHMNPNIRRVVNTAFTILRDELKAAKLEAINEI